MLLEKMLDSSTGRAPELLRCLEPALVEEMNDGGMGSLRFLSRPKAERRFGAMVAEAEFYDEDGVVVSAAVNVDQWGDLYELDIWKTDFTALKRWPNADEITVKTYSSEKKSQ